MVAIAVPFGASPASASLVSQVRTFGTGGSGAGQLNRPQGVAIHQTSGNVLVADSNNARVDRFDPTGQFISAFGWGVKDGRARAEVCTKNCLAGLAGSGAGQFSSPVGIAISGSTVYVGDAGNNVVDRFDTDGNFNGTIDGTSTPQGHFQNLVAVAADQAGNLWTADGGSNNVDEFNSRGTFVRQWNDAHGSPSAIAVDSANGSVYLITSNIAERWTVTGQPMAEIDRPVFFGSEGFSGPTASALALDPSNGNLYVDHDSDPLSNVTVYDHNGIPLDDVSLGSTDNSQGLAFRSSGSGNPAGQQELYLSDASNNNITILGPQTTAGAPLITAESSKQTGTTTATLAAGIVPLGHDTTCTFQFVDNARFNASGYSNATSVPCAPADQGSGFTYRAASADLGGLSTGTVYHFRVVATSSVGTTTGSDQEVQAGPGAWAPFSRCPVDDAAMLAASGGLLSGGAAELCLGSNSTHGSITLGTITTATGSTNLQAGLVADPNTGVFSAVNPAGGAIVADPVQLDTIVGPVTVVTESAGTPSNFDLFGGISTGQPIITIPIKVQLENNPILGPSCSIGSDQNPILLNPQNTDLSNAKSIGGFFTFDAATGLPDLTGPDASLLITGAVQRDDMFAVPGATGCGPNDVLDGAVDATAGVPSASGSNHLVLDDASSALAFPNNENGQAFANDWHSAFG
jgi:hypothetical protein